jgi:hypothetical protein
MGSVINDAKPCLIYLLSNPKFNYNTSFYFPMPLLQFPAIQTPRLDELMHYRGLIESSLQSGCPIHQLTLQILVSLLMNWQRMAIFL